MKIFGWNKGRQESGYRAFTLIYSSFLRLDCHILHYPSGSSIPPHKDQVESGTMWRLNIELWRAEKGGQFNIAEASGWSLFDRIWFFAPSEVEHSVTKIEDGSRWVFSIGKILG